MFKNISELGKISTFVGLTSSAVIFFSHTLYFSYEPRATDWKDIALAGCIGSILASKVAVSGYPWSSRY